jgi:hypothetical protein
VDKQVELSDAQDGALYLLIEAMVLSIRQFLTFEQRLNRASGPSPLGDRRPEDMKQSYFDGLELLRGHLSRCVIQIAAIAGMEMSSNRMLLQYQEAWPIEAYQPLPSE